ncbi:hypothetical protein ACFX2C_035437 [Malus domestica]
MLPRDQERGDQNNFAVAAFQTRKQVSISSVLLTNEILVMRKIVENLSQRSNTINLCDVYEDENGVHLWRNVLEKCLADRDSFLAPFSPSISLSKISCQNRVGSAGLLHSGLCIFTGLNLQALHFSSSAAQVMGNYSHMMLKLMQNGLSGLGRNSQLEDSQTEET